MEIGKPTLKNIKLCSMAKFIYASIIAIFIMIASMEIAPLFFQWYFIPFIFIHAK